MYFSQILELNSTLNFVTFKMCNKNISIPQSHVHVYHTSAKTGFLIWHPSIDLIASQRNISMRDYTVNDSMVQQLIPVRQINGRTSTLIVDDGADI